MIASGYQNFLTSDARAALNYALKKRLIYRTLVEIAEEEGKRNLEVLKERKFLDSPILPSILLSKALFYNGTLDLKKMARDGFLARVLI